MINNWKITTALLLWGGTKNKNGSKTMRKMKFLFSNNGLMVGVAWDTPMKAGCQK